MEKPPFVVTNHDPYRRIPKDKQQAKRRENLKYRAKARALRDMEKKKERDDYWASIPTLEEQLESDLIAAKLEVVNFMRRTGRNPELRRKFESLKRRGISVMDVVTRDLKMPKSYLTLRWNYGHRRTLNRDQLRKICVKIGLRYWKEMRTREQMACLLIIRSWEGIDLETESFFGE